MTTIFRSGWDHYKHHYQGNQAYLDCFNETQVLSALGRAYTSGTWSGLGNSMLRAACDLGGGDVFVEQGPHQPESMAPFGGDGFALHVTTRHRGHAFHVYIQQGGAGQLEVIDLTW